MPDNLEVPTDLPVAGRFFGSTTSNVIVALAIYGAGSLTDDARRATKRLRANWKARQAIKAQATAIPTK